MTDTSDDPDKLVSKKSTKPTHHIAETESLDRALSQLMDEEDGSQLSASTTLPEVTSIAEVGPAADNGPQHHMPAEQPNNPSQVASHTLCMP